MSLSSYSWALEIVPADVALVARAEMTGLSRGIAGRAAAIAFVTREPEPALAIQHKLPCDTVASAKRKSTIAQ